MPFTFAHPAIVLPLLRIRAWVHFPAVVLGTLTPDCGYYLDNLVSASRAHTLPGSVLVALPVSIVLFLIGWVLHSAFLHLVPQPHRSFLQATQKTHRIPRSKRALWLIPSSLLIGIWSHNFWDAFTHKTGWFVERLPLLQSLLVTSDGQEWRVFNFLQYGSGLFGVIVCGATYLWLLRRWKRESLPNSEPFDRFRWIFWSAVVTLTAAITIAINSKILDPLSIYQIRVFAFRSAILSFQIFAGLVFLATAVTSIARKSGSQGSTEN